MDNNESLDIVLRKIKTTGDKILDVPLAKVGGKGLFVKEIEEALIRNEIDLAVHSMKDVPSKFPDGLGICAVTAREDHRDVLLSRNGTMFDDLPRGARIGTSSLRRKAQLLNVRADLNFSDLRGNVQTRIGKMQEGNLDGVILAAAGIIRLGLAQEITEYLPVSLSLPAIGQGVIGVECRLNDDFIIEQLGRLNDSQTTQIIAAERAFLEKLEGGCQVPIGGYAVIDGGARMKMSGFVGSVDGSRAVRDSISGKPEDAAKLGRELATRMLKNGAEQILREVYSRYDKR